jgi:hypothetical protein
VIATIATVQAPRPHWAVTSTPSPDSNAANVVHEGTLHRLSTPDGTEVAEAQVEVIIEVGDTYEPMLVVQGHSYGNVPIGDIPAFTKALRDWADALDAEAVKVGGLL